MEQHPVPRNISGFQFRLVGDMTLRQFGYLVAGAIIAYIVFRAAPFPLIINFLLAGIFGFIGIAFAFLPIQERPLDKWFVAFIKSITSPTQFTWRKANPAPEILVRPFVVHPQTQESKNFQNHHEEVKKKLHAYLATLPTTPHENINVKEKKYIDSTLALFSNHSLTTPPIPTPQPQLQTILQPIQPTVPIEPPAIQPIKTTSIPPKPIPFPPQADKPMTAQTGSPPLPQTTQPKTQPVGKPATSVPVNIPASPILSADQQNMQKQLSKLSLEKKLLEEELTRLQQTLAKTKETEIIRPAPASAAVEPTIKTVTRKTAMSAIGIPALFQYPNMIVGAVKDPEGKILPNIILTIKDKSSLPLRALKTNKLGQFQTATPLPNGVYFLETEDPLKRYVFDIAEITLSGKVCLPIEITAKGKKELMREKLSKQLFGNVNL